MLAFLVPTKKRWLQIRISLAVILGASIFLEPMVCGQAPAALNYQMPPKAIADLVDAPPTPEVRIGPDQQWLLLLERPNFISIEELSQPELRLAGVRINPRTHGPSRSSYYTGLKLLNISEKEQVTIKGIPQDAKIRNVDWSPDGKHIAFVVTRENGQDLWVVGLHTASAQRLISERINSIYGSAFEWLPDSKTLLCKTVPDGMEKAPAKPTVPRGPVLQETSGKKANTGLPLTVIVYLPEFTC